MAQPAEVQAAIPGARQAGSGRLVYWGFDVYDAALWVGPGFRQDDYARHPLALELSYLRSFTALAIARRSLDEMRRMASIAPARATQWQRALANALPDVARGDRITGLYRPDSGAFFLINGAPAGEVRDPEFARLFFAIWLSPATSEPALRSALLAKTGP